MPLRNSDEGANQLGAYQADMLASHKHQILGNKGGSGRGIVTNENDTVIWNPATWGAIVSNYEGGYETRPQNASMLCGLYLGITA